MTAGLGVVAALIAAFLMSPGAVAAQTLDELQGPLLPPGQVTVAVDQTSFASGRITVEFGCPACHTRPAEEGASHARRYLSDSDAPVISTLRRPRLAVT